jgi:hypothetical protein
MKTMKTLEQSTKETAAALTEMIDKAGRKSYESLDPSAINAADYRLDKHYNAGTITLAQYRQLTDQVFGLQVMVSMAIDDQNGWQPQTV